MPCAGARNVVRGFRQIVNRGRGFPPSGDLIAVGGAYQRSAAAKNNYGLRASRSPIKL